jgi:cytoskeletal protein CcmA (bactofilin family)
MFERGKKDGPEATQDSSARQERPSATASTSGSAYGASSSETAIIGRSIHIDGDLRGEEDLRIEGDVNGTVQLKNNSLTIGKEGKIRADVYAKSVTVDGLMEGDIYGSERVSIRKNAQVLGNITAPRVSLEDGARFKGSIEMDPAAVDAALGKNQGAGKSAQPRNGQSAPAKPMPAASTRPADDKANVMTGDAGAKRESAR